AERADRGLGIPECSKRAGWRFVTERHSELRRRWRSQPRRIEQPDKAPDELRARAPPANEAQARHHSTERLWHPLVAPVALIAIACTRAALLRSCRERLDQSVARCIGADRQLSQALRERGGTQARSPFAGSLEPSAGMQAGGSQEVDEIVATDRSFRERE